MGVKNLAVLSSMSLMAAGVLGANLPAEAAVLFGQGDELSISGSVDFSQGAVQVPGVGGSEFRFEDVNGNPVNAPGFGNFGVLPTSTGAFAQYINNGALDSDYKIRSFDIASTDQGGDTTPTVNVAPSLSGNFLSDLSLNPTGKTLALNGSFITLEGGFSGKSPDVQIFLDEIVYFNTSPIGANQLQTVVSGNISAIADNQAVGVGSFNATFVQGDTDTSYSATFVLNGKGVPVPEPTTTLGLLAFGALAATRVAKRKQS